MTEIGDTIAGRYVIEQEIGRGGFSIVYAARDAINGQPFALKLLVPPPASVEVALERLRREVRAVERLEHPSIARVHALIEEKDRAFIVMERVCGESLGSMAKRGPVPIATVQEIGVAIARALEHAHHALILHRDVKPENIMVPAEGPAKLVDFGSARVEGDVSLTRTGGFVGTLDYLAPEVLDGARPDGRADVFGLGMSLFHAITGALPKRTTAHLQSEGHHPSALLAAVPAWLDAIVARATAADPRQRFPTMSAMLRALEAYRGTKTLTAGGFCLGCATPLSGPKKLCRTCQAQPAEALMFVDAGTRGEAATQERLQVLLGPAVPQGVVAEVARGMRPLVGVRRGEAGKMMDRLDREGIGVRVGLGLGPQLVVYGVSGAVLLSAAVLYGMHWWLMAAAGGVLSVATTFRARAQWRTPVVQHAKRSAGDALPPALWARVARAQGELEDPSMSGVLIDLAEMAQALGDRKTDVREIHPRVIRLFEAAVSAAQSLARIDATLKRLDAHPALKDQRAQAEEARSALVQRMLESTATMSALVDGAEVAKELETATADLAREVELRDEAMAEVDAIT